MNRTTLPVQVCSLALFAMVSACGNGSEASDATEAPAASLTAEAPAAADAPTQAGATTTLLDPNQGTRDQLLSIDEIDAVAADALIAGRPYNDMIAVDRVLAQHLTESERETVYRSLWRPIGLNTASAEEILLIPGVGERMQHEFEEYRPYRAMAEFRREIGKYVDEAEVARLEQYVAIR